jgi:DNA-binding transcriptional LysR family regulator
MDRLAALQAFVRVAEAQSFSGAALRLGASKSAVSRLVSGLEADLGVRLFHRTTRSLALTEAGRGYFERTSRILADLEEADLAVSELQAAPRGLLRVSAPMSFGFLHLAPALPAFFHQSPEVSIDLTMNDRFVDVIDVAVRIGNLEDSGLIARRLAPIRLAICASPAYLAARGTPQVPADLKAHECLCNSNLSSAREWRFAAPGGQSTMVEVSGRLACNNGDALRAGAVEGMGVIILPTFIVGEDVKAGRLVRILQEFAPRDLALHAVYPPTRHLSPKVRAFVDFLAARFGPKPYWDCD